MRPLLLGVPSLLLAACASVPERADPATFHDWTAGELGGVTPEAYEIAHEHVDGVGSVLRLTASDSTGYQSLWTTVDLPAARTETELAVLRVRQRRDELAHTPMVWVRANAGDAFVSMVDSRGDDPGAADAWHEVVVRAAIAPEADVLTLGVGLVGNGTVEFVDWSFAFGGERSDAAPSPAAAAYLERALELVEDVALHAGRVDWTELRATAFRLAAGAREPADTYVAIRHVLERLGDGHSHLLSPRMLAGGGAVPPVVPPHGRMLAGDVGYVHLAGHGPPTAERDAEYAAAGARVLERCADARGFVVDLRDNGGGTMWPMLAAVGPLLGAEEVGAFAFPEAERLVWWWRDGRSGYGGRGETAPEPPHGATFPADLPVAVLLSGRTASSGEALTIAFLGRRNVRTFGAATQGLTTNNATLELPDGALLLVTNGWYEDRGGARYAGPIAPDVALEAGDDTDLVLEAARAWVLATAGG